MGKRGASRSPDVPSPAPNAAAATSSVPSAWHRRRLALYRALAPRARPARSSHALVPRARPPRLAAPI